MDRRTRQRLERRWNKAQLRRQTPGWVTPKELMTAILAAICLLALLAMWS